MGNRIECHHAKMLRRPTLRVAAEMRSRLGESGDFHCGLTAFGLTLIEVVAGLALLSSLLVVILVSFGRSDRQLKLARRKLEAVALADQLLTTWYSDVARFPVGKSGSIDGQSGPFIWQTEPKPVDASARWGLQLVRLTVWEPTETDRHGILLAKVDVVLPMLSLNRVPHVPVLAPSVQAIDRRSP